MLPAANRLRSSREFADAVRAGRRVGRGTVVVHLKTSIDQPESRELSGCVTSASRTDCDMTGPKVGFVVSKAVGGAVVRNKVKRRLRHLVAARLSAYPMGTTLVVRALPAAAHAPFDRLSADLDAALAAAARPRRTREAS
ncbi:MAG: ribonuclease P protein component [Hamadaea sp.]|nr:ribonuclease P protein component [Hamadaea sp.]